ncbi:MAG: STAS domain-containing protein [Planctomycetota bacterium]|jgi:anti-anti-sigma factor
MPEPEPTRRLHAVDIKTGHGVVAAKIIGPAVEANRAAVIQELVGQAIDECGDDLHFVVFDLADVDFLNSSAVAAFLTLGGLVKEKGAEPVIYRATDNVVEILWMVKAGGLLTFAQTADELEKVLEGSNQG